MAASAALTSSHQDLETDPPGDASGGAQTTNNTPENRIENGTKKLSGKDGDVSKCPQCAVPCCTRTGERLYQTTFFPCPLEPHPSSRLWAKAIGVKAILKNMYICEDHFQLEDDLENYLKFKYYPRGQQRFPRFKKGVVPWRFPKCRGSTPTAHHHRVPFSKTEFYKRQRARINKARGILSAKENNISPKELGCVSKNGYCSQPLEPSKVEAVQDKAEPLRTTKTNRNREDEQNIEAKRNERSSGKKRKSEGRKNSVSSDNGAYFNLLNGDLSSLIAHVQPAICSWDVSEVKLDQSGSTNQADSEHEESNLDVNNPESFESISSKNSTTATSSSNSRKCEESSLSIPDASMKPVGKPESASIQRSEEESEDEIYMTPSEDEMNGYHDTSDTDFTISSEESWGDHEIVKPTRRSARNQSKKTNRIDRYSPPIVLRSRAKKRTVDVVRATEPTKNSPKSSEKCLEPDESIKSQNSDSGVSSGEAGVQEIRTPKVTTSPSQGEKDGSETVENKLKEAVSIKSPAKISESKVSLKKPEKSHVEHFLQINANKVIQAVSGCTSDSESIGDTLEDSGKNGEPTLPKPPEKASNKVVERKIVNQNVADNPKWRLRETKCPPKGAQLSVDMSNTVAKVFFPESQASYSYKKVNVVRKPGTQAVKNRRGKQDNFLLVRDGDQVLSTSTSLPPYICGLISNMRSTFDSLLDDLDDLKTEVRGHHSDNAVDSCLAEPRVDRFLNELKKHPDLLELEMAQFAIKCEKFYGDQMEKSLKNSKKVRWCNTCENAARFHCCFSAAYCCRLCQSKDWGRHNRHCGQSRMLLGDPDLKLNPFMSNRLRSVGNSKPTIGTCMTNLEELHQAIRRPTNGQRTFGGKNQSKRGNTSLCDSSNPKAMRTSSSFGVRSYLPKSVVAKVSSNNGNHLPANELQSEEDQDTSFKTEPPDVEMEVERGSPPPRPNLVLGYSLGNNISPTKSSSAGQQVRITIPPNVLASLPSNVRPVVNAVPLANNIGLSNTATVNAGPRITSVAVVSQSAAVSNNLVLPRNTSTGTAAPLTLRCKTVLLPNGETQYIPVDGQTWSFKPNAQLVVKQINQAGSPITLLKQATTSGSILITRPAKPAYSKFIPLSPAPTQTITSVVMSPGVPAVEDQPRPLTARLPKLTPVTPKAEPPAVRTLDSSELDKILSTDHLKEAFDISYASNILRP